MICVAWLLIVPPHAMAQRGARVGRYGAPSYKIALTYSRTDESIGIAIAIKPKDVTARNLVALACELQVDYPAVLNVGAEIFNDLKAARHTFPYAVESPKGSNESAYIGRYRLDRKKGIETLVLALDLSHPCGNDIEINLKHKNVSFLSCD